MNPSEVLQGEGVLVLLLLFARLAGLAWFAPPLRASAVPRTARIGLAAGVAWLIFPTQSVAISLAVPLVDMIWFVLRELLIGSLIGIGAAALVSGICYAGHLVAQQAGLAWGELFDLRPNDAMPALQSLFSVLAITLFLLIGGHRLLMRGLLESFERIPPGSAEVPVLLVGDVAGLIGQSFELTLRVGAPAVVSMLVAGIALGFFARMVPRLQGVVVGLPLRVALGLFVVAASLFGIASVMDQQVPRLLAP